MFLLFISWIDVIMTLRRYFFVEILSISLSANRIAIKKWIEREKIFKVLKKNIKIQPMRSHSMSATIHKVIWTDLLTGWWLIHLALLREFHVFTRNRYLDGCEGASYPTTISFCSNIHRKDLDECTDNNRQIHSNSERERVNMSILSSLINVEDTTQGKIQWQINF